MTDIEEQIAWIKSEAKLYDEQGLTSDMEYGDKLFAVQRSLQSLLDVVGKLSWLCGEVERDHELDRLSVDSEDCAKACREALKVLTVDEDGQ